MHKSWALLSIVRMNHYFIAPRECLAGTGLKFPDRTVAVNELVVAYKGEKLKLVAALTTIKMQEIRHYRSVSKSGFV